MKKYTIVVILLGVLSLFFFNIINHDKCEDKEIYILGSFDKKELIKICNYQEKLLNLTMRDNNFNVENFYELGKFDKDQLGNVIEYINKENLGIIDKIQIYYLLKHSGYTEKYIEDEIGALNEKYKSFGVSLNRIRLAENLLTTDYRDTELDGIEGQLEPLSYEDVKYLDIIFELEPERFSKINLVTELEGGYSTLGDEKSRKLYIDIFEKLLLKLDNKTSIYVIKGSDFMNIEK